MAAKAQKITIKLPWEIMNVFSDVLPDDDEEDDDDIEAHEASKQRLKVRSVYRLRVAYLIFPGPHRKQTTRPK